MTQIAMPARVDTDNLGRRLLAYTGRAWFAVAIAGQCVFALYIVCFYLASLLRQDMPHWNRVMPHGYVPGDTWGNLGIAAHVLLSLIILLGGSLQWIGGLRRRFPKVHRWIGRSYVVSVMLTSVIGLAIVWLRGSVGDTTQHLGVTVDALLILWCATQAWKTALARRFDEHRRWALRLYVVASAVWFYRLMLSLWIVINHGPAGFDPDSFTGPTLSVISFANSLLPLLIAECYMRAERSLSMRSKWFAVAGMSVVTLLTAAGIATAYLLLWAHRIAHG